MAPKLSEDEIDDLIYFSRAGELADLQESLKALSEREGVSVGEIITAAKDEGKSTCLHMAAGNGHLDAVKALIEAFASRPADEKKAYVDAANEFGNTGLHWACLGGHLEVVKLLVENGASPAIANDKDQIPLDSALFNSKREVADWFLAQSGGLESGNQEGLNDAAATVEIEDDGAEGDKAEKEGEGSGSKAS
ncbi:ankyrin repeat containing protein yar1 [Colletotrichum truncatum]|uniref:Ankyrin repeat containing protein yar1 n=1 Tax=Colletotrichum truncatum TaxID=5467 RepID=A0ACC3ZH58_COLTU|nr:ankyrin repeat containing protein yar1 [Colletotrichum truncatum]KAF6790651.1 ankyrin repeat containing protein yar1 [Colletotrichum truncatum]